MASPQIENGFTRIANELLEAIYSTGFNGTQFKILLCVIRYTYGFKRKSHDLSISFISKATGVSKRYVSSELSRLIDNKVIAVLQEHTDTTSRILALNKNYTQWNISRTVVQQVNNTSTGEQEQHTTDDELFTTTDDELFIQERNIKENTKEIPIPQKSEKEIRKEVYDYYMTLGLVNHQGYRKDMDDAIKTAMKNNGYTVEDCKKLLDRHKQTVEATKGTQYQVRARPLHEFFGQKAYQAKHLICAEYEEGGKHYQEPETKEEGYKPKISDYDAELIARVKARQGG